MVGSNAATSHRDGARRSSHLLSARVPGGKGGGRTLPAVRNSDGRFRSNRDHRWPRRQPLVHRVRGQQDRPPQSDHRRRITEFTVPTTASGPEDITVGPDGNLWFTEETASQIGSYNPTTNTFRQFATLTANSEPYGITRGPDGNLWFTENGAQDRLDHPWRLRERVQLPHRRRSARHHDRTRRQTVVHRQYERSMAPSIPMIPTKTSTCTR